MKVLYMSDSNDSSDRRHWELTDGEAEFDRAVEDLIARGGNQEVIVQRPMRRDLSSGDTEEWFYPD
jgi:hypothetical protein